MSQTPTAPAPTEPSATPQEQSPAKESAVESEAKSIPSHRGIDVLGPDNASVGRVNDLLFDGTGKIIGVVIGVGGFLGIGTKNVAIDMSASNTVPAESGAKTTPQPATGTTAPASS